ncbi:hypothetical protein ACFSGX_07860 [Sphingomonas arantia]|uniref:Uncharacterized protein n=1 Tax=Sphingomonas arantia TaxID=1460676 RepID=A0ABW4TXR3_9SPHN
MTALNMMIQRRARAGYIISDGATTAPDGTLLGNSPKIIMSAGRFPWAAGVTGSVPPASIHAELGKANPVSLKQLLCRLPGAMRSAIQRTARDTSKDPADLDLALVGVAWDFDAKAPSGFIIQSRAGIITPDAEPFVWYETDWNLAGGEIGSDAAAQLGRACDLTDPKSFDPERDGLALIERQRRAAITPTTPGFDTSCRHRIGGDIDMTVVTRTGVQVWCIHKFPDVVGEPIRLDEAQ